jgi:hypothetical protein
MLDVLSAFDRGVVEFSMGVYNIPRRDRVRDAAAEPTLAPCAQGMFAPAFEAVPELVTAFRCASRSQTREHVRSSESICSSVIRISF